MYEVGRSFLTSYQSVFLCAFCFLLRILPLDGEMVMGRETIDFDFDGLPGSVHEFKFVVLGRVEECFYQPIADRASFFLNLNVIRGGDKLVDFYVKDHSGKILHRETSKSGGSYRLMDSSMAIIGVCIDNVSRFSHKLVHISMMSIVVSHWDEFQKEIEDVHLIATNFSTSLTSVEKSIGAMKQSQVQARFHVVKDFYLSMGNNYYVQAYSLGQCALIVLASIVQVFSVRRLFKTTTVTPTTNKPRA